MAVSTTQIGTVTVPALVISFNGVLFTDGSKGYDGDNVIGKVLDVPCRDILFDNSDSWGIPVKDSGIFTGMDFELKNGVYLAQPTYDSIPVFRIRDTKSDTYWIVYGTKADLIASCSTCCDGTTPIPMPMVSGFLERIAPCQALDITNDAGAYYMPFGVPTLGVGETFFPYGSYNNVALTAASSAGYANITTLLAFMNTNWNTFVWTKSADNLTIIGTGGVKDASLCVNIIAVTPS